MNGVLQLYSKDKPGQMCTLPSPLLILQATIKVRWSNSVLFSGGGDYNHHHAAWWCNGLGVGLAIKRLWIQLLHSCITTPGRLFTPLCACHHAVYLVSINGRWCFADEKVTVGLASCWPRDTSFNALTTYEVTGDAHIPSAVWHPFTIITTNPAKMIREKLRVAFM